MFQLSKQDQKNRGRGDSESDAEDPFKFPTNGHPKSGYPPEFDKFAYRSPEHSPFENTALQSSVTPSKSRSSDSASVGTLDSGDDIPPKQYISEYPAIPISSDSLDTRPNQHLEASDALYKPYYPPLEETTEEMDAEEDISMKLDESYLEESQAKDYPCSLSCGLGKFDGESEPTEPQASSPSTKDVTQVPSPQPQDCVSSSGSEEMAADQPASKLHRGKLSFFKQAISQEIESERRRQQSGSSDTTLATASEPAPLHTVLPSSPPQKQAPLPNGVDSKNSKPTQSLQLTTPHLSSPQPPKKAQQKTPDPSLQKVASPVKKRVMSPVTCGASSRVLPGSRDLPTNVVRIKRTQSTGSSPTTCFSVKQATNPPKPTKPKGVPSLNSVPVSMNGQKMNVVKIGKHHNMPSKQPTPKDSMAFYKLIKEQNPPSNKIGPPINLNDYLVKVQGSRKRRISTDLPKKPSAKKAVRSHSMSSHTSVSPIKQKSYKTSEIVKVEHPMSPVSLQSFTPRPESSPLKDKKSLKQCIKSPAHTSNVCATHVTSLMAKKDKDKLPKSVFVKKDKLDCVPENSETVQLKAVKQEKDQLPKSVFIKKEKLNCVSETTGSVKLKSAKHDKDKLPKSVLDKKEHTSKCVPEANETVKLKIKLPKPQKSNAPEVISSTKSPEKYLSQKKTCSSPVKTVGTPTPPISLLNNPEPSSNSHEPSSNSPGTSPSNPKSKLNHPVTAPNNPTHKPTLTDPKGFLSVEPCRDGGATVVRLDMATFGELCQAQQELVVDYFFSVVFGESGGVADHVMGIISNGAREIPNVLGYLEQVSPGTKVKQQVLGKKDVVNTTIGTFCERVRDSAAGCTYADGGLQHVSLVGTKAEESGALFPELIQLIELNPFLEAALPWGPLSRYAGLNPDISNDGPIFWVRPGEQFLESTSGSRNHRGYRLLKARETLVPDRTPPHADHSWEDGKTIVTVGAAAFLQPVLQDTPPNVALKDVIAFDAAGFYQIAEELQLDLYEPPMTQCDIWIEDAKINQLRAKNIKFAKIRLKADDIYFIPRNVVHQFKTVAACLSVAWHVRLKQYYDD